MNASPGVLPCERERAGRRRHASRADVVLDDDRDAEQRAVVPATARLVRCASVGEGRRADRDDRVEGRVELADPLQVELRQLHRFQPVRVHQLLELRDRRRVDVDTGDLGVRRVGREADQRRGTGESEQERQQGRQDKGTPKSACSSRYLPGLGDALPLHRSEALQTGRLSAPAGTGKSCGPNPPPAASRPRCHARLRS